MARKFLIAFLSGFIAIMTLTGIFVAGYRTKSAIMPIKTPVEFKISEDGENYIFSFWGEEHLIPRKNVKRASAFLEEDPRFIPVSFIISSYLNDKFPVFYRL